MTCLLALLAAISTQDATDSEAADLLREFNRTYAAGREDEGRREGSLALITQRQHPKLLGRLIEVGSGDRSVRVRIAVAQALGSYRESQAAADALVSWLREGARDEEISLNQRCLESLGSLDPDITRAHVDRVNVWIRSRDIQTARTAIRTVGAIRHRSSIEPLLAEMKENQRAMLAYIRGHGIANCDGD